MKYIKAYTYHELSEEAQMHAVERERAIRLEMPFHWADEWHDSVKAFQQIDGNFLELRSWDLDGNHSLIRGPQYSTERADLEGVRAWKYFENTGLFDVSKDIAKYPLTGFCGDWDILEPLEKFRLNPGTLRTVEDVLFDCYYCWARGLRKDYEAFLSDECIKEDLAYGLEYYFYRDGVNITHLVGDDND